MLGGRGFGVGSLEKISDRSKEFCLFSERTCDVFILDVMKVFIEFERVFAHSLVLTVNLSHGLFVRKRIL